ncbi:MAG: LptF/LptG family permease [Bacteroidales bacterium]|nr:LptF/LptG family permease [Bacteroidales bacterium]
MKKIDRLILRSFIGPLVLTFTLSVLVLLMQFVWKYVDDLVGKGLEFSVIAELLMYASATFVPMALPIAVLFASIMTMGNFGEKYELVAMKAGGISVRRAMMPMAVVVVLLTGMAFYFANNVMPTAMLKYRMTLYDITRKKPAVNIRPGEYYKEFDGYVIRVGSKGRDGRTLQDIIIYDHSRGANATTVIVAQRGFMEASPDNQYLKFTLYDGYSYSEESSGENFRTRPLTSIGFRQQSLNFDISSFAYNKSVEENFKGSYQMMNINQLDTTIASLERGLVERTGQWHTNMVGNLRAWSKYTSSDSLQHSAKPVSVDSLLNSLPGRDRRMVRLHARNIVVSAQQDAKMYGDMITDDHEYINRHYIEWHRKFTLSIACLLLFLIGAPFGSIVRKGGLGLPLVASVGFFVLYYVVGMIAEKAVRESAIGPEGMWISSLVMLPIGIILTLQATTDSSFFDGSSWRKVFRRLFRRKQN